MQNISYPDPHLKSMLMQNNTLIITSKDEIIAAIKDSLPDIVNALSNQYERNNTRTMDTKEVCATLRISRQTLTNWVEQGKIPQHKIGGRILYLENEINDSIKKIKKYNHLLAS